MDTINNTQVEQVRQMTNAEMRVAICELQRQVAELVAQRSTSSKSSNAEGKEMTDDDARAVLTGNYSAMKHKDAATALGLTYGQVYSCRKEFTFKHIHKEMKDAGTKNPHA
jgi:hypothetical protein